MKFIPESNLQKKANASGGKTAADAIRAADANLLKIKDEIRDEVDDTLAKIKRLAVEYKDASQEAVGKEIYELSNTLIGMAKVAGFPELGEAAYSLCDLVQSFISKRQLNRGYLTVHVDGMWLLRYDTNSDEKKRSLVLQGLRQIVGRA